MTRYLSIFITFYCFLPVALLSGEEDDLAFFEKEVKPVLTQYCYECHSHEAEKAKGGLVLDSRQGLLTGGDQGPAISLKDAQSSLLLHAVNYKDEDMQMPPDGKLDSAAIQVLQAWAARGFPHAKEGVRIAEEKDGYGKILESHWAFQPIEKPEAPPVEDSAWVRSPIDAFVLAKLEEEGLEPVGDADALTLLRRLSFDLVGLPPSLDEQQGFSLADVEARVDDLLARDQQFGERWGRHWLDVARYAESNGKSRDSLFPHAWRYRDYVYDAVGADLPFDDFLTEQIAGDLLEHASWQERDRRLQATGFLAIGSKTQTVGGDQFLMDLVDDQMDTITKSTLALSVGCARCHDHKFDPIPTADYYAMAGIFASTQTKFGQGLRVKNPEHEVLAMLGPEHQELRDTYQTHFSRLNKVTKEQKDCSKQLGNLKKKLPKDWEDRVESIKAQTEEAEAAPAEDQKILAFVEMQQRVQELNEELKDLRQKKLPEVAYAMTVADAGKITDTQIRVRGEAGDKGDIVPRGFLSCIPIDGFGPLPEDESGRLELAQWLTHPDNPLTARVAVNRVWLHLFGRGLVNTPDNFGVMGEAPSHPELLDYLAARFVELGWSRKALIREIVLSHTYQLSSDLSEAAYAVDPDNRHYWRMSRRRLDAEPLRDAVLAAGGNLTLDRPEFGSRVAQLGNGEVGRGIDEGPGGPLYKPFPYRAAYLPVLRTKTNPYLKLFDFPEPSNPVAVRNISHVPAQALWFMNNSLVLEQAEAMAERVVESAPNDPQRIQLAYRICFSREPSQAEIDGALSYLRGSGDWAALCQALIASAEFRFID